MEEAVVRESGVCKARREPLMRERHAGNACARKMRNSHAANMHCSSHGMQAAEAATTTHATEAASAMHTAEAAAAVTAKPAATTSSPESRRCESKGRDDRTSNEAI